MLWYSKDIEGVWSFCQTVRRPLLRKSPVVWFPNRRELVQSKWLPPNLRELKTNRWSCLRTISNDAIAWYSKVSVPPWRAKHPALIGQAYARNHFMRMENACEWTISKTSGHSAHLKTSPVDEPCLVQYGGGLAWDTSKHGSDDYGELLELPQNRPMRLERIYYIHTHVNLALVSVYSWCYWIGATPFQNYH